MRPGLVTNMKAHIVYSYELDGVPKSETVDMTIHSMSTRFNIHESDDFVHLELVGVMVTKEIPDMSDPLLFGASHVKKPVPWKDGNFCEQWGGDDP